MGNLYQNFKADFSYSEFRENFKFSSHDLDLQQTVWGRKVRAVRPFLLTYVAVTFTLSAWEMQFQLGVKGTEMEFYEKIRKWFMPRFYDYLDIRKL
jgi:hypothetical protein